MHLDFLKTQVSKMTFFIITLPLFILLTLVGCALRKHSTHIQLYIRKATRQYRYH